MQPRMTDARLRHLIAEGRGMGTGDGYLPWLSPHKSATSACSNPSYVPMPLLKRHCYFLSDAERDFAHLLWWLGAADVREQFPLWPWPHPSPFEEVDPSRTRSRHPGVNAIAQNAWIQTYRYPGLPIDHVLTIDLMATFYSTEQATPRLLGVSCKPADQFEHAEPCDRLRARLELDRRYCEAGNIRYLLAHGEQLPPTLVLQLEWLAPLIPRSEVERITRSCAYHEFIERLNEKVFEIPACVAAEEASRALDWPPTFAQFAARLALWRLDVDVDLRQQISMASPLPRGGRAFRTALRAVVTGAGV